MREIFIIILGVIISATLVVTGLTYLQAEQERGTQSSDVEHQTRLLADSLKESAELYMQSDSLPSLQSFLDKFADRDNIVGLAVYDADGTVVASTSGLASTTGKFAPLVENAVHSATSTGEFMTEGSKNIYVYVDPLNQGPAPAGALVLAEDVSFVDADLWGLWQNNILRLVLQTTIFLIAIIVMARWLIYRPTMRIVEAMRAVRLGEKKDKPDHAKENFFYMPLAGEISRLLDSLTQARVAASIEARMRLEKIDTPWTEERLKEFTKAYLKDRSIFVVSNREPYIHTKEGSATSVSVPASGMVTALGAVMEACGGMWIAHGSGTGDRETADGNGKLRVPPDDPKYTLKRIFLSPEEIEGHYTGFSNEALWPLCHMAHTRPIFRREDWNMYIKVNKKFADALLAEIKNVPRPLILVQDFHFALLPAFIKARRPDAQVAVFWHIPWPSAESFSICPYRKEILEGILGADVVGFHTQQYCNNFMESVGKEIESVVDLERFAITREGHRTFVKPLPISIAFTDAKSTGHDAPSRSEKLSELGIDSEFIGLGVDRLDYTKGILERFKGIEYFLDVYPKYRERFTFLQIAPPSRESVEKYREYNQAVTLEAQRINQKFATRDWKPIVLEKKHYTHQELDPLYRRADVCLVTSLHDGMNLVAKEYVASRDDGRGVLILSQFTGASRDLSGAIIINPYSAEETAEALHQALVLPIAEQQRRMKTMRTAIKDYNVYRWSAELIKAIANLG